MMEEPFFKYVEHLNDDSENILDSYFYFPYNSEGMVTKVHSLSQ